MASLRMAGSRTLSYFNIRLRTMLGYTAMLSNSWTGMIFSDAILEEILPRKLVDQDIQRMLFLRSDSKLPCK